MPISPKPWPKRVRYALALALGVVSASAAALTTLDMRDGASATVHISQKDPTRLTVAGAAILEVIGGSVRSETNPAGTLSVSQSAEPGDAFVMPLDGKAAGATSIFVVTERATYTLILTPADIPADTVIIRDRAAHAGTHLPASEAGRPYNRERSLFELLRAVAGDAPPPELQVSEVNRPVTLWQEARFTHERRYTGHPRWTVDVYMLTNVTDSNMVLDEREFVTTDVAAVALEQANLAPGQSTLVRVVRASGAQP